MPVNESSTSPNASSIHRGGMVSPRAVLKSKFNTRLPIVSPMRLSLSRRLKLSPTIFSASRPSARDAVGM